MMERSIGFAESVVQMGSPAESLLQDNAKVSLLGDNFQGLTIQDDRGV